LGPVTSFQHLPHPFHGLVANANWHQHAGDIADHVMQECIGFDIQHHTIALPPHGQFLNFPDWMLCLALSGTE